MRSSLSAATTLRCGTRTRTEGTAEADNMEAVKIRDTPLPVPTEAVKMRDTLEAAEMRNTQEEAIFLRSTKRKRTPL